MVVSLRQAALSSAPGWLRQGECRSAEWPPESSQTKRESNVKEQSCDTYIFQLQDKHLQWDFRRYLAMSTLSGRVLKSVRTISLEPNLEALKRRMMSWRVAATTKYSCFNLSSLPSKNYKKTGTKSIRQVCKNHVMSLKEYIYIYAFSRCFYPKRLTSGYTFFVCVCVPWELNSQPFALLTECSTTKPGTLFYSFFTATLYEQPATIFCCVVA